jgi:hypothetical protein
MQLAFKLLVLLNLSGCLHEVFLNRVVAISSDCEHTRFSTDHSHVSSIEIFAEFGDRFEIKLTLFANSFGMNFQNVKTGRLVRKWDLNLAVHSTWSEEGWIKLIGSVCCHHALHLTKIVETIKLV